MRAGTYATAPMAQTEAPAKTWQVDQNDEVSTGGKSKGAQDVSDPNNAGGLGDKAGVIMLDRIVDRDFAFRGRTRERVVLEEPAQIKELVSEDAHH